MRAAPSAGVARSPITRGSRPRPSGADHFTRYEVIGWYGGGGRSVVSVSGQRAPDAEWFGAPPRLVKDVRGEAAESIIRKLPQAVATYPYANTYHAWPGPNSNTFVAHLGREIAELSLTLPSTAIGKDYLPIDAYRVDDSQRHGRPALALRRSRASSTAATKGLSLMFSAW